MLQGSHRSGSESLRALARRRAIAACPPDPFADASRYPGIKIGARGTTVPVGSYYGEPTGIVGLRLFPNPDFDEKARAAVELRALLQRSDVLLRSRLSSGRTASACRAPSVTSGPNPIRPPADPEEPKWENLSSNVGAQYFWWDRVFNWRGDGNEASFFYQALHVSRPGTLDTSLVSTDSINNPRTMNAVYYLLPRMMQARKWGKETIAGGERNNKQFNDFVPRRRSAVAVLRLAGHRLDAARAEGRLRFGRRVSARSIASTSTSACSAKSGCCISAPVIGGKPISPIPIETAEKNSVYWRATELQTPNMARFFLAEHRSASLAGCAGRRPVPRRTARRRCCAARKCSPSAARDATRASCRRCPPGSISRTRTAPIT